MTLLAFLAFVSIALPDGLLGPSWPAMGRDLGVALSAVGLLYPAAVVSSMASSGATGFLLGRVGIGRLLALSTGLSAVALAAQAAAPTFLALLFAVVALSAGSGAIDAALNAVAARRFSARLITWLHACYGLGAAAGPLLVAAAAAVGQSWRWAFAVVALAQAALALAFVPTARRWEAGPQVSDPGRRSSVPRGTLPGALLFLLQTGVEAATALWALVYLTEGRGVAFGPAASAVSGYWVALLVGRLVAGGVAGRVGPRPVLVAGLAGMGVGAALLLLPGPAAVAGVLTLGFAAAPMFPLLTLTTRERVAADGVDRAVGVQVAASAAGAATVPALTGLLVDRVGPLTLVPCLLGLIAVLAVAFVLSPRHTPS